MKLPVSLALVVLTLQLIPLPNEVSTEKILVLQIFASKSHKITYMNLLEKLAGRGHQIKIISSLKPFKKIENITEVFTFDTDPYLGYRFSVAEPSSHWLVPQRLSKFAQALHKHIDYTDYHKMCEIFHELPQVKQILNETYDLVFMQPFFNDCVLGFVYRLNVPFIWFSPMSAPDFVLSRVGYHLPSSYVPSIFVSYSDDMTFGQRMVNFGLNVIFSSSFNFFYDAGVTRIYREKLGQDIPDVDELGRNVSLIFSNGHFSLHQPKPFLPDTVDVGGIHCEEARPLPKDLEDFISQGGEDGFILFSMGTLFNDNDLSDEKRQVILKVFSRLKQQVIWKWDAESMAGLPQNVKLSKWLPQQDLLGHPKIRLFITHCGGGSTEEAIYHGVPIVGIPVRVDQPFNAQQAKRHGILVEVKWTNLTEVNLFGAINEVLSEPRYQENAHRISTLFRDQPEKPVDRGVYWVEYVMRHKGAPQLRSSSRKLSYFQYQNYDVILTYLLILISIGFFLFKFMKFTFKLMLKIRFPDFNRLSNTKKYN